MTADEILAQCDRYLFKLANQAARWFHEDPEDWVQEFRLEVVRYAHNYDAARGAVTTWLTFRCRRLVAVRRAAGGAAKRAAMPWETLDATDRKYDRADAREAPPGDAVAARELVAQVRAAVAALGPRDRMLVDELFSLDGRAGMRLPALAERLGVTKSRVQQLAVAALERVGEQLAAVTGDVAVGKPRLVRG